MESLKIVLLGVGAAVVYGILLAVLYVVVLCALARSSL